MSLYKIGSIVNITKRAYVATEALSDQKVDFKVTDIIEQKNPEFLYYTAKAISSLEPNFNLNGNFDGFPKSELKKAYKTFEGRGIFLNHDSDSPIKSVGRILSAEYMEDEKTGAAWIEILGRIDRVLHPEIARKIEVGDYTDTSMGCSVDESVCSVCAKILHSDADERCQHLGVSLGKRFAAEVDMPEYGIVKGQEIVAGSINRGIVFNEDSLVNVPADATAKIRTILNNMKHRFTKTASLTSDEKLDFVKQFENLLSKVDSDMAIKLKAEFCGICPPAPIKESSMSETNLPNEETKKILNKISAYEMGLLESYVAHKTKKANEIVNKEVVADATKKEETFLSKIVAKVKDSFAAQLLEKKIETVAKEEIEKEAMKCPKCKRPIKENTDGDEKYCQGHSDSRFASLSAKFNEDKNNVLASTWEVYEGNKLVLDASLKDIWDKKFETLSFADQKWATSEAYGLEAIARYQKEGLEKLAEDWDVSHKLSKTAKGPELGPDGSYAKPSTGTDNKKHNYPTTPKFTDSKPGANSKGPAAPKPAAVKTETKLDMPGQEKGQTGPAAPKAKEVKTDYAEPKAEAEGKEVKTTPKNPEEKKMGKSEKEVKTDYKTVGEEAKKAEEEGKEKKEDKKASLISWASLTPKAQNFIKTAAKSYIASGMKNAEAVAKAHGEFAAQEKDMKKQAADKPVESVEGSTLPEGTKEMGDKPEEAVKGTTLPGGAAPASAPEISAQGDTEHKTTDLTKKPEEAVKGTTTPADHISNTEKSEESVDGTTFPADKKEVGDKADSAVKQAAKSENSAPIEAVQDKPALSNKTVGDKAAQSSQGDTEPKGSAPENSSNESVKKSAATEMPMPEDKPAIEEDVKVDEKPALLPEAPKPEAAPAAEVSAFDKTEKLDIGTGYSAHKDHESKEIIIEKDGKEVKRLPDGFGAEVAVVLPLLKAVLGLPAEEAKPEVPGMAAPMEEKKEEVPAVEEHPALQEAHEDELGIKESALKVRETALLAKEATLKAKEETLKKEAAAKKFAEVLKARSERCHKIVAAMVEKNTLEMDKEVYASELQQGTYLLDAQKKAFEHAITAKHKEFLAMTDEALLAAEKVIADLKPSVTKKASNIFVSPSYGEQMSEDEEIAKIFRTMGNSKQHPQ